MIINRTEKWGKKYTSLGLYYWRTYGNLVLFERNHNNPNSGKIYLAFHLFIISLHLFFDIFIFNCGGITDKRTDGPDLHVFTLKSLALIKTGFFTFSGSFFFFLIS